MGLDVCDHAYSYFGPTAVRYATSDHLLGLVFSLFTLSPIWLVVSFVTLLLGRGFELQVLVLAFGTVIDMIVNLSLKHVIHEARPGSFCANQGNGMPSHHTQFMFFFATYCMWFLINRVVCKPAVKGLLAAVLLAWPVVVGASRVYLTCHTWQQVLVGALVGSGGASLYYAVAERLVLRKRPVVRSLLIGAGNGDGKTS